MREKMDIAVASRAVICTTPAAIKSFMLKFVEVAHQLDAFAAETAVRAMTYVVREGLACSWGTSEWLAQQITALYKSL